MRQIRPVAFEARRRRAYGAYLSFADVADYVRLEEPAWQGLAAGALRPA